MQHRSIAVCIGALVLATSMSAGAAESASFSDGDDTAGRFDLRVISSTVNGGSARHVLATFARWKKADLSGNVSSFQITIDTDNDDDSDRVITIELIDGSLEATIRNPDTGRMVGEAGVTKSGGRTVEVQIPVRLLGSLQRGYAWQSRSVYLGERGSGCQTPTRALVHCTDLAPNRHRIEQDI